MKVRLISVSRMSGIAKSTGQPFGPLFRITTLRPIEMVDTAKFKKHGNGFDASEIEVSEEVFKKFATLSIPVGGLDLELTVEQQEGRRGLESVVTGFVAPSLKAAA